MLTGGDEFFSNGIHLNLIEAAEDPARESWQNLNAIDDLVCEIINTESHLVIAALALAADHVYACEDAVLNPYYGHMGRLDGSEYWTYLLPRRVGPRVAAELTRSPFTPLSAAQAVRIGVIDTAFGLTADAFRAATLRPRSAANAGRARTSRRSRQPWRRRASSARSSSSGSLEDAPAFKEFPVSRDPLLTAASSRVGWEVALRLSLRAGSGS